MRVHIHVGSGDDTSFIFLSFHFTTGKFPFEGENVYKLFGSISTGLFTMPADLPPLLQDLLRGTAYTMLSLSLSVYQVRLDWLPLPCIYCLDSAWPTELPR